MANPRIKGKPYSYEQSDVAINRQIRYQKRKEARRKVREAQARALRSATS